MLSPRAALARFPLFSTLFLLLMFAAAPCGAAPSGPAEEAAPAKSTVATSAIELGESAPDFDFVSDREGWRSLRRLCARQPVLLVIEPDEKQLLSLQADFATLEALGVEPMAVLRQSDRANWALIDRLKLRYSLLSDPAGVVATTFEARDAVTGSVQPAWFVMDQRGRVCSFERGALPAAGISSSVALALRGSEQPVAADDQP
jgi:peroxiredoxin